MITFKIFHKSKLNFEGKKEGEEVILLLRRHWYTLVAPIGFLIFACILPLLAVVVFGNYIMAYNLVSLALLATVIFWLAIWFIIFYMITMYSLDTWIVTTKRVVDSTQHGFFSRKVSELSLSSIQDISIYTTGMIPTMMDFGYLEIQTAGAENKFLFQQIPHPQKVKDAIVKAVANYKTEVSANSTSSSSRQPL